MTAVHFMIECADCRRRHPAQGQAHRKIGGWIYHGIPCPYCLCEAGIIKRRLTKKQFETERIKTEAKAKAESEALQKAAARPGEVAA